MTNITEEQPNDKEQAKPEPQTIEIPVEIYVELKSELKLRNSGRPIILPEDLTPSEYNWFTVYMEKQYKKLVAQVRPAPKKLKGDI